MKHPTQLGPFKIVRVVGRGGMGAVYEAIHEDTNEVVALKVLMASVDEDLDSRNRFEAEIETLKRLRHPNIVRLYGFGQEEGMLYYAMEFVDGPSLANLLKDGHIFTWEETIHIGMEICKALRHAHDRGIIHRDIKPANILLLKDGQVKVSDYGIAHFFGDSRLTTANMVIGTIEFMSPEQAQAGPLTPKSDIYSLGALLYALLTGQPPYRARSLAEILQRYRTGPPESIRFTRPEVPSVMDLFIMELLRVQPDKRPKDARIIARRLEAIRMSFSKTPTQNPFLVSPVVKKEEPVVSTASVTIDGINPPQTKADLPEHSRSNDELVFDRTNGEYQRVSARPPVKISEQFSMGVGNDNGPLTDGMTILDKPTEGADQFDFPHQTDQTARQGTNTITSGTDARRRFSDSALGFTLGDDVSITDGTDGATRTESLPTGGTDFEMKSDFAVEDDSSAVAEAGDRTISLTQYSNSGQTEGEVDFDLSTTATASPSSAESDEKTGSEEPLPGPTRLQQPSDENVSSGGDAVVTGTAANESAGGEVEKEKTSPTGQKSEAAEQGTDVPSSSSISERPTKWTSSLQNMGNKSETARPDSVNAEGQAKEKAAPDSIPSSTANRNRIIITPQGVKESSIVISGSAAIPEDNIFPEETIIDSNPSDVTSDSSGESKGNREPKNDRRVTAAVSSKTMTRESHFTFVHEEELGRYVPEGETQKYVSLKIWAFSIISISVGLLFWFSLRSPGADTLYERIDVKIKNSDDPEYYGTLRSVEKEMRSFITLYPNDTRAEIVLEYISELDLGNLERRLERQIERKSRDGSLSPVEDAYVRALQLTRTDPEKGIAKLKAFIVLFSSVEETEENTNDSSSEKEVNADSKKQDLKRLKEKSSPKSGEKEPVPLDEEILDDETEGGRQLADKKSMFNRTIHGRCVLLAKRRLSKVIADFEHKKNAETVILEGRMEWADELEAENPKQANAIRQAIIDFYGDQQWAQGIIEQARKKISVHKEKTP